ncbi:hypothetical protein JCM2811A_28560 [Methylorubrum rhodinum]
MKLVKSLLLGTAAGLTVVGGAQAADLPVKKAVPIEYVRVCTAYGAGFFYIPGTDTCLRISGRARAEYGYIGSDSRNVPGGGDLSGFTGLARFNVDARTQTGYGTLRAFLRLDAASRTGHTKFASGTNLRIGYAYSGTGQDQFGRVQNFMNVDKAFVQFAGLTAGRASSFFDFYAADYEIIGSSLGSNLASTNLLAWTQKFAGGWSATISMEDPNYRKNPLFSDAVGSTGLVPGQSGVNNFFTTAPTPIILATNAAGNATAVTFVDAVQRSRMPDFVGSLRYDAPWGSAQLSAAVKDINIGGGIAGSAFTNLTPAPGAVTTPLGNPAVAALLAARGISPGAQTEYGWAVQAGAKFNLPWIAPGDGLYLQGAYGEGANNYTGINRFTAGYLSKRRDLRRQSVQPVPVGRDRQPAHRQDRTVQQLHGGGLVPPLLVAGVALGPLRQLRRDLVLAGRASGHQPDDRHHRCGPGPVPAVLPDEPRRLQPQRRAPRHLSGRHRREPDLVAGQGSRYRRGRPVHQDGRQERPRQRLQPRHAVHGVLGGRLPGSLPRPARLLSRPCDQAPPLTGGGALSKNLRAPASRPGFLRLEPSSEPVRAAAFKSPRTRVSLSACVSSGVPAHGRGGTRGSARFVPVLSDVLHSHPARLARRAAGPRTHRRGERLSRRPEHRG